MTEVTQNLKLDKPKNTNRYAKLNLVLFVVVVLLVIFLVPLFNNFKNKLNITESLFESEKALAQHAKYFYDDFEGYDLNSEVLDRAPEDLSRWQNKGVITVWTNIQDWQAVDKINLKLSDANGKSVVLGGLENVKSARENNKIKSNDEFVDYNFRCQQRLTEWEDFLLVNGRNLLFYEYTQPLGIDMSRVVEWKAYNQNSVVEIYDAVIHDGLCKKVNSLNGVWYSPNGLPQYGVWWTEDGELTMRNVEQAQYPSNGDHVRILSSYKTPKDFILRTRFTITATGEKENSYIRLAWDFDDKYDPGHDQSLIYASFEYGFLGIQRVYPIERYFVQGFEPDKSNRKAKTRFTFKQGRTYEIQAKVEGQKVLVEVYEIKKSYFKRVAKFEYVFITQRPEQSYPFSFEATGDVQVSLDEFEVWKKSGN